MTKVSFSAIQFLKVGFQGCTDEIIAGCSLLFSNHYGVWENGSRVKFSPARLKAQCMYDQSCGVALAQHEGLVVGHCFFTNFNAHDERAVWITQLVVHSDYRHLGLGKQLLHMALPVGWRIAAIVSSHPFAIRGFERATACRCSPIAIQQMASSVMSVCPVPYLHGKTCHVDDKQSIIDTEFPISHAEVDPILAKLVGEGEWHLGNTLPKGSEFLGIVRRSN